MEVQELKIGMISRRGPYLRLDRSHRLEAMEVLTLELQGQCNEAEGPCNRMGSLKSKMASPTMEWKSVHEAVSPSRVAG